jgi:hypothetical protein
LDEVEMTMALYYHITVNEYLDDSWSAWFDGLTISHAPNGATTLAGSVRDQTALYGLIARARDLGLTLIAVVPDTPAATREFTTYVDAYRQ